MSAGLAASVGSDNRSTYTRKLACVARYVVAEATPVFRAGGDGVIAGQEKNSNKNASAQAGSMNSHFISDSAAGE